MYSSISSFNFGVPIVHCIVNFENRDSFFFFLNFFFLINVLGLSENEVIGLRVFYLH